MKFHYYPETDSLYVELKARLGAETHEISAGLNVDLDAEGNAVGLDIDQASTKLNLATLRGADRTDSWLPLLPSALLYPVGTVLIQQGDDPNDVFYVEEGLAKLVRTGPDEREQILGLRGPGWFLGAALVLTFRAHPASAVALTPCRLRRLTRQAFLDLMTKHEALSWHVHQMHSREVANQFQQTADLETATSRQRLERFLRYLTEATTPSRAGDRVRLSLPLKRWELASLIAVTPEHLSRLLRQLRDDGVIRVDDGTIVVPDVRRLAVDEAEEAAFL